MATFEAHQGQVSLEHPFQAAHTWLTQTGTAYLRTSRGTSFEAVAAQVTRGPRRGEKVIRYLLRGQERARAYPCCWGHYYNCNRTRIGMYCVALDVAIG
jgi:hypothetical protein